MIRYLFVFLLAGCIGPWESAQNVGDFEVYIGATDSRIEEKFGPPDEIADLDEKEAVIWTYFTPSRQGTENAPADSLSSSMAGFTLLPIQQPRARFGYRQFAFWNGRVAAFSSLQNGPKADSMYKRVVTFLDENANWLGFGEGSRNSRITRRGDDVWIVDIEVGESTAQAVLKVGDAGYMMCSKARLSELRRIKAEFGINL